MNTPKAQYIQRIRSQSSYPTFRTFVGVIALLFYIIGAICILVGISAGISQQGIGSGMFALFAGVLIGIIYIVIGKVIKEASLMLADIADSITDLNSRNDQQ